MQWLLTGKTAAVLICHHAIQAWYAAALQPSGRQAAGASHSTLLSAVQSCWTFDRAACEETDAHFAYRR